MVIFKTYGQKWPFQEMEGFWLVLIIIQRWNKDQDNVPCPSQKHIYFSTD